MNSLDACRAVEARSKKILEPWFDFHSGMRMTILESCASAHQLQRIADMVVGRRDVRGALAIELKAEEKHTDNLFVEEFSNYNVRDACSRAEHPTTLGWGLTCGADLLAYHFLDKNCLYLVNMQKLIDFVFGVRANGQLRSAAFPAVVQSKYKQPNVTVGRLVRVTVLQQHLGEGFHYVELDSLLDAQTYEDAVRGA
jgi:hypothetical protein